MLAGNVALESMGFETFGFGFGRPDVFEPDEVFWGPEDTWLGDERYSGDRELANPLGAVQMGLIYVNPEGPNGNPDPLASARDIRETFARMAMDDEETVALIVGGHTFGKCHGAASADHVGPEPEGCPVARPGPRLAEHLRHRRRRRHHHQRPRGRLDQRRPPGGTTATSTTCSATTGSSPRARPAPSSGRRPNPEAQGTVPDAHDPSKRHAPMMLTTDLALRFDPVYEPIARRFHENPDQLADAFAKAWYKLLHRDMGPVSRYLGPWVPEPQLWQDPVPAGRPRPGRRRRRSPTLKAADPRLGPVRAAARRHRLGVGRQLPGHRQAGRRQRGPHPPGPAEGLGGQRAGRSWPRCWPCSRASSGEFNAARTGGVRVSLADLIVLGGCGGGRAGGDGRRATRSRCPFPPGRTDATQEQTDVESFAVLEPRADGFRNYRPRRARSWRPRRCCSTGPTCSRSRPTEMTVLVGGMRALDANVGGSPLGVLTDRPGVLTNDVFVNLLDSATEWTTSTDARTSTRAATARTGELRWTATGGRPRASARTPSCGPWPRSTPSDDAEDRFVRDFVAAWAKVMELDRFDLR